MSSLARVVWILGLAAGSLVVASSVAANDRVIVLVPEDPDMPGAEDVSVTHRIVAELRAVGFDPVIEVGDAAVDDLFQLARDRDAVAVIRLERDQTRARVCVADRATGKIVLRDVEASGDDRDLTLALRAVELLRASLLELSLEAPPEAEVEISEEVRSFVEPPPAPPPVITAAVSANVWWAIDGPGPLVALSAGARWRAIEWLAFGLEIALPLAPPTIEAAEGSAELFVGRLALDARVMPLDPREVFQISLGLGAASSWVYVRTRANAPYVARDADAFDGSIFVRAGASLEWGPLLVELAALLDWAPAPVTVLVLDRREAQWGPLRTAITLTIGLRAG